MTRLFLRLLILILLVTAGALRAGATNITIPSFTIPNYSRTTAPKVRIYYTEGFTDSLGVFIAAGSPTSGSVYKVYTTTLLAGTVTVPEMVIASTRDGIDSRTSTVSFYLYENNTLLQPNLLNVYVDMQVPSTITSATGCSPFGLCGSLAELKNLNAGFPPLPPVQFYDAATIDRLFSAIAVAAPVGAPYITTVSNASLTGEFALSSLSNGLLKHTGGTPATAVAGTDYLTPSGSGALLTALNASNLGSGTVPDARFPSTLPALNGSLLTALNATNLGSGTVPDARFPSTLPALNGSLLTALNATQLTSGTVPLARISGLVNANLSGTAGITNANLANSSITISGTANQISVSGGAPVSLGGTATLSLTGPYGPATYTSNGVLYGNGTGSILVTAQGAANSVLQMNAGVPAPTPNPTVDRITSNPAAFVYDLNANTVSSAFLIGTGPASPLSINVPSGKVLTGMQFNANNTGSGKLVAADWQLSVSTAAGSQDIEPVRLILGRVTNSAAGAAQKTTAIRVGSTGTGTNASLLIGVDVDITPTSTQNNASTVFAATVEGSTDDVGTAFTVQQGGSNPRLQQVFGSIAPIKVNAAWYRAWMGTGSSANARSFQALNNAGTELFYVDTSANLLMAGVQIVGTNPAQSGQIRIGNNVSLNARNAANSGDFALVKLNASNELEFGASGVTLPVINQGTNAYFQVGTTAAGWLFQNVDSDSRLRFFKQGSGEFLAITATGITSTFKGANVASAGTITATGNSFHVTGTTNITSVSGTSIAAGTTIVIIFDGVLTFTDGSNLKLAGNFVTTADDTITLVYDGTNWYETARAVN